MWGSGKENVCVYGVGGKLFSKSSVCSTSTDSGLDRGSNGEIQVRGKYLEGEFSQVIKFDKENIRRVGKFKEWKY